MTIADLPPPDPYIDRCKGIGGSDAHKIMTTDWIELWEEKTRRLPPVDLSDKLNVQLGIHTEVFNGIWFTKQTGIELDQPDPYYVHPSHDFMYAHLDGIIRETGEPFEAKHTYDENNLEGLLKWYMPQLQHYLAITGHDYAWLSVIFGNRRYNHYEIARSNDYIASLIDLEAAFWWHVKEDIKPDVTDEVIAGQTSAAAAAAATPVNGTIIKDMTGDNQWAALALDMAESALAHDTYKDADKAIRKMVPANARCAHGHGVILKRDSANRLRFKFGTEEDL